MGPAILLKRLGVVRHCKRKHHGTFSLVKGRGASRVAQSYKENQVAQNEVLRFVQLADEVGKLQVVTSCKQWAVAVGKISAAIDKTKPAGFTLQKLHTRHSDTQHISDK